MSYEQGFLYIPGFGEDGYGNQSNCGEHDVFAAIEARHPGLTDETLQGSWGDDPSAFGPAADEQIPDAYLETSMPLDLKESLPPQNPAG